MKFVSIATPVASAFLLMVACGGGGGDGGGDVDVDADAGSGGAGEGIRVLADELFSGFDGVNTYRVPVVVQDPAGKVSWTISDPSLATLSTSGNDDETLLITTKKAGDARVTATVGRASKTLPLRVYAYTADEYAAGKRRYETNRDADNPACASCHGGGGPNHSPSEIGRDPDDAIVNIILTGVDPDGAPGEPARIADRTQFASLLRGKTHQWSITDAEKKGLVAYIRALAPRLEDD